MTVRYYEPAKLPFGESMRYCRKIRKAVHAALELEGLYTGSYLLDTAWSIASNALYDGASPEEAEHIAMHATRRRALAIPGLLVRVKYARSGKLTPASCSDRWHD